jgi:hypothetical protein
METKPDFAHLPYGMRRRLSAGQPLITKAEMRKLQIRFAAFLRRAAKPDPDGWRRYPERLLVIAELLLLRVEALLIDCMYACMGVSQETLKCVLAILTGADSEVDRTLREIERLSERDASHEEKE